MTGMMYVIVVEICGFVSALLLRLGIRGIVAIW